MLAATWKFVLASALAACASALIMQRVGAVFLGNGLAPTAARIAITSAGFSILYLGLVIVLHRGCAPLYQLARLVRGMAPAGKLQKSSPIPKMACAIGESAALAESGVGK
jgi:hypothetical protein